MAESSDTLTLAAEERAKQGIHELEISFGGELDLHKHYNHCQKNSRHKKFIPINKLVRSQLPKRLIQWVQRVSDFTVKLSVNYVSPNRPPGYPLSDRAGQRILSVGSGYVTDFPATGNNDKLPCPFTNCGELPGDHEVCGYITVVTAAHVVFDDEEAKNTTVEFLYDDPDDRSGVVTARGVKVVASSVEGDFCELLCVTHNTRLFRRLNVLQRYLSNVTVRVTVNCVSPKRPTSHQLSDRTGHRIMTVGSGYVTDFPATGSNNKLPCPFTNCGEFPGDHEVYGYITVVTAAHVVFDDEEAKNTTVEFLYDDSVGRRGFMRVRGVNMSSSSVEGDFCELLCVTHDENLFHRLDYLWRLVNKKGRRICHFFLNTLPGLESIECVSGKELKFLVKINLNNPSEGIEALVVLGTFTEYVLDRALANWSSSKTSLREVLSSNILYKQDLLTVINVEIMIAELVEEKKFTVLFSHLHSTLRHLQSTVINCNTTSPQAMLDVFMSLISELAQFYSTVGSLEKRLSLILDNDVCVKYSPGNRLKVVNISNGTATMEVALQYLPIISHSHMSSMGIILKLASDNDEYEPDLNESQPDDMLLVHIAHPHGQSKQVTIGRQTDCFTGDGFYHQLYTAPTCPGCSGGPVWMIPASGDFSQVYGVPHSGHYGNELNKGSSWTIYPHECCIYSGAVSNYNDVCLASPSP